MECDEAARHGNVLVAPREGQAPCDRGAGDGQENRNDGEGIQGDTQELPSGLRHVRPDGEDASSRQSPPPRQYEDEEGAAVHGLEVVLLPGRPLVPRLVGRGAHPRPPVHQVPAEDTVRLEHVRVEEGWGQDPRTHDGRQGCPEAHAGDHGRVGREAERAHHEEVKPREHVGVAVATVEEVVLLARRGQAAARSDVGSAP
mmetsp:Transcript_9998/g.27156  ORF Transcript_9998/g.27156 Transcript_9998/m.27156 type:complete len:200 (+) Transcript_9998:989-1588(+)